MIRVERPTADVVLCVIAYVVMLAIVLLWYGILFPRPALLLAHLSIFAVASAAMVLRRSAGWLTLGGFVALAYFCYGVMEWMVLARERWPASAMILASCGYFLGLVLFIRRYRANKAKFAAARPDLATASSVDAPPGA